MQKMHRAKSQLYWYCIFFLIALISCKDNEQIPAVSFYYWKTKFELGNVERNVLEQNSVQALYVRYFDIDIDPAGGLPKPVSVISFDSSIRQTIIPVVYIKNHVWEKADSNSIFKLSQDVRRLIEGINAKNKLIAREIQFDCDWTEKTKDKFFLFLQYYKKIAGQKVSATIRLHQVKYSQRTGIPPVDNGVLMFYNMGAISAGDKNSIYEKENAMKYVSSLKHYPLQLDIALPVFSWGIGIRNGRVEYLLNKMYAKDFEKDSNFARLTPQRFKARLSFFKSGYYIAKGDEIKVENIEEKELSEMIRILRKNISRPVKQIIFYDLDESNLINYDSDIFKTVSQEFY